MTSTALTTLRAAGTALIADIFDTLSLEPPILANDLTPAASFEPFAGPAYTVEGRMQTFSGGDREKLSAIDNMPSGCVAVWAGHDAAGVCLFGDLLATSMHARGVAAAVVDGGVRDSRFLAGLPMPVLSRYRTPAQGIGRWKVSASQVPVEVRGGLRPTVTVHPGDIVVGDSDGVIVIPAAMLDEISAKANAAMRSESEARGEIAAGLPLLAALAKYGHL